MRSQQRKTAAWEALQICRRLYPWRANFVRWAESRLRRLKAEREALAAVGEKMDWHHRVKRTEESSAVEAALIARMKV